MDYYNEHKMKSTNDEKKGNSHLNKMTGIVLSVSVFGLVISQSSIVPLFVHFYDNLVMDFKLFSCTTERNCIFLLCNGILFFIIQSSGLIGKIKPVESRGSASRLDGDDDDEADKIQEKEKKGVGKDGILEEKTEEEEEDDDEQSSCEVVEEREVEEREVEEEEEAGGMDVEELNKKCEDFIRKMKKVIQN